MRLTDLHLDVLLNIIQYIDTHDIYHLGQTCRTFHGLWRERAVWASALRYMRRKNAVFPPASSLRGYSLDKIRRYTTAPARFIRLLIDHEKWNEQEYAVPLMSQRRRLMDPVGPGDKFNTVVLVSGGRVVVTGSSEHLSLWDLDEDVPRLVHAWDFPVYHIVLVCFSEQGYLRVAAIAPTLINRTMALHIFDFDYVSSTPKGSYSMDWELEGNTGISFPMHTLSGDNFIYNCRGILMVWNFIQDTWSSWSIIDNVYEELFVVEKTNLIVFISRNTVAGWRPNLEVAVTRQKARAEPNNLDAEFILTVPYLPDGIDSPTYFGDRMWNREAIWYESTQFSSIFDIAYMDRLQDIEPNRYAFSTYDIHLPGPNGEPGQVKLIYKEMLPQGGSASTETAVNAYRISNGYIFKSWSNHGTVQINMRSDPRSRTAKDESSNLQVNLELPDVDQGETLGIGAFSFDPVSGRLCHLIDEGDAVAVLDYLPQ